MRLRTAVCLLLSCLVLFSCGSEAKTDASVLIAAVEKTDSLSRVKGSYQMEITFGTGATLYFASGEVCFDRDSKEAYASLSQTYLGDSSAVLNYYRSGTMISVDDGEAIENSESPEELFSLFPYCLIPQYDEKCSGLKKSSNGSADTYSFSRSDGKEMCDMIVGGDLYTLSAVITEPQTEKTEYGSVSCVYTLGENGLSSVRYEFSVILYDKEPYVPGYSTPTDRYTLTLNVTARLTFDAESEFSIPEYVSGS